MLFLREYLLIFDAFVALDARDRIETASSFSRALAAALRAWLIGLMRLEKREAIGRTFAAIMLRFCSTLHLN